MKKIIASVAFCFIVTAAFSQSAYQRIEDSVIGWAFKAPLPPFKGITAKGRTLTPGQKANMVKVIEWMMKSYTPVGGVGTFKTILNIAVSGNYADYRQHSYWIDFRVWNVDYEHLDASKHFEPISEEYYQFPVRFNAIPESNPLLFLNSPNNYFFVWPPQGYKEDGKDTEFYKEMDPKISPNCAPFLVHNESLFLVPNNKLPFLQVTVGQYLDELEKSLVWNLEIEKKAKDDQFNQDAQAKVREEVHAQLDQTFEGYRKRIADLRKMHKNELDKPAILRDEQPSLSSTMWKQMDPFAMSADDLASKRFFPLYKVDPAVMEKCKGDQPQWISFSIPYARPQDGNQHREVFTALSQNVNYQYIYDYFFNPSKVKGIPYTPADEAGMKKRLANYGSQYRPIQNTNPGTNQTNTGSTTNGKPLTTTSTMKKSSLPNVLLDEDFSSTAEGTFPRGWYSRSIGKTAAIIRINGLEGNWLKLGGTMVMPTTLPQPLPANFTLSYDVATDKDFTGRTGAAAMLRLSTAKGFSSNGDEKMEPGGQSIELRTVAGSEDDRVAASNFRALVNLEIHDTKGTNKERYKEGLYLQQPLPEFTSRRTVVHVKLQVKNNEVRLFVNDREIAEPGGFKMAYGEKCIQCGLRPGTAFNILYFTNVDDTGEGKGTYIGNIRLTKE